MGQSVSFNINLKVNGKDVIREVSVDMRELRRAVDDVKTSAEKSANAFIGFNQHLEAISNVSDIFQKMTVMLNSVTEEARSFSEAMSAANTMAGKSGQDFERLKEQVAELSKEISIARDLLANGLYQTISNGVPEDNWLTFLEKSAKASVGGLANLEEVVKVTSTVIKNYGLSWEDAGDIQDKIQLTAKYGVTSFEQMAQALPRVTANAATLGVTVNELMSVFATLTGVSGNTAEVSTQLAAVFTALVKPSSEATEMAQRMGIQFDAAAVQATGGIQQFIKSLDQSVKSFASSSGMLEQEIYGKLFGSAESLRALIPLTGELADKFDENVAAMEDSAGTINDAFDIMADTTTSKIQLINNRLGDLSDVLYKTFGNITPYANFAAQTMMALAAASQLTVAMRSLHIGTKIASVSIIALSRAKVAATAITRVLTASFRGEAVGATTAAVATRALSVAIKGLLVASGVGVAIVALTEIIGNLSSKSDEAAESVDDFSSVEDEAARASAQAKVELDGEIKKLHDLIQANGDAGEAVQELNAKYGEAFGEYRTAAEWYDTLTRKSGAYIRQLGLEAQARAIATSLAEKEIALESNRSKQEEMVAAGTAVIEYKAIVTDHKTKTDELKTIAIKDSEGYAALKTEASALNEEIAEGQRQLDILNGKLKAVAAEMQAATQSTRKELLVCEMNFAQTEEALEETMTKMKNTTDRGVLDKLGSYKNDLLARQKELREMGVDDGSSSSRSTGKTVADPLEGSIDWYRQRITALTAEIEAAADEGVARAKQAEKDNLEKDLDDLKVRIGIDKKEDTKQEARTLLQQLQDELQAAQDVFDNTDPLDIPAKVSAQAEVDKIQARIDATTAGSLTIPAEISPAYVVKGSDEDMRQSYGNARRRADRVLEDFDMGLIDKTEAERQIDEINEVLSHLGDGLKPIVVDLRTDEAERQIGALGSVSITSYDDMKANLQALSKLPQGVSKGFATAGDAALMLGSAMQQLGDDSQAAKAGMIMAAVGQIALSFAQALASCKTWVEWMAFGVAGLAQTAGIIATVGQFATGGIVPGTQRTGDKVLARVNSGEMILNAQQQARLFAIANGAAVYGQALAVGGEYQASLKPSEVRAQLQALQRMALDSQSLPQQKIQLKVRGRDLIQASGNELRSTRRRSNLR